MPDDNASESPSDSGSIAFYLSQIDTCPYLEGLDEQKLLARLDGDFAAALYDRLIRNGFRRSRDWAYRPRCPSCSACTPVRLPVADFRASRSWRRVLRLNADLESSRMPVRFQEEHWRLFRKYLDSRHGEGEMAAMQREDYRDMVSESPVKTVLHCWSDEQGDTVAVCIVDEVQGGYSAVYSFYDPALAKRSLGSFMILDLIESARRAHRAYVYLGYWVQGGSKMDYKARFRPLEAFGSQGWKLL